MKKIEKNTFGYAAEMEQAVVVLNAFDYLVNNEDVYVDDNTSIDDIGYECMTKIADGDWNGKYRTFKNGIGEEKKCGYMVLRSLADVRDYFEAEMNDMHDESEGEEYSYPVQKMIEEFFDKYYDFYSWVELSEASEIEKFNDSPLGQYCIAMDKFFDMYGYDYKNWRIPCRMQYEDMQRKIRTFLSCDEMKKYFTDRMQSIYKEYGDYCNRWSSEVLVKFNALNILASYVDCRNKVMSDIA